MTRNTSNKPLLAYKILHKHYGPQAWWPAKTRLEVIVGAILTQNTAWTNVEKAIASLKRAGMLSSGKLKAIDEKRLARLIRPAGYYNIKARRIKNFIEFFYERYGGSMRLLSSEHPAVLRRLLLGVNGIGPETCDSIMLYALDKRAFVVDAYTKRVFSRHSLIKAGSDYHEVQKFFIDNLPKDLRLYNEYHALIVRLAKDFCRTKPICKNCPLMVILP